MGQLLQSVTKSYYKVWQKIIAKCGSYFKVWEEVILKWVRYYKLRQEVIEKYEVLQAVSIIVKM